MVLKRLGRTATGQQVRLRVLEGLGRDEATDNIVNAARILQD